jgi:hypothetical protein
MDTKAAILALITACGFAAGDTAYAQDSAEADVEGEERAGGTPLLNKVWVRQDDDSGLPGIMHVFLEDGTLVSDSCWETYRLSRWQQVSESEISWEEDGMTIEADIAALSETELVLNLKLGAEVLEQRFAPADVPYVCPDMVT